MKILIVSGFLGAGKTTFIRHLTDTLPQVDFAIFENEIGETDLDAKVLRDGDRSLNVYEMTENCVCCTGKADFLTNLMTILSALDPEVLIVEPTGAARLSALMGAIEGLQYDALELLPPLTLVDAGTFFREKDDFSELRLDQIRHGSVLVLSKSEQLSPEETAVYRQELQELAPEAEIITGDYKKRSADWFRSLLEKRGGLVLAQEDHEPCQEHHHHDHDHHHGEEALTTVTLTRVAVPHPLYLMRFLDLVTKSCFGRIPRAKGYLPCGNEWVRFDLVQDRWLITGFPPQAEARVTLIGTRLKEEAARSWFEGAEGAARSGL